MKKKIVSAFYDLFLTVVLLVMIPKALLSSWRGKKSFSGLWQRLGCGIEPLVKGARKLVWIHAVSLGETKAVAALVTRLRETMGDPLIVVSSITATGHAEAKASMPFADRHLYLPFDLRCIVKRVLGRVTPDLVIIMETDYWYHFLQEAHRLGARLAVVNGKLSERSTDRYKKVPLFARSLFGLFDSICVQSPEYFERFRSLGVDPTKINVTGNLKFDAHLPALSENELTSWRKKLGISASDWVVTVGSTHAPEEKLVMDVCKELWKDQPSLKLLLVPRHPERFNEVAALLKLEGIEYTRLSDGSALQSDARVVLIDGMGVLKECYQLCQVALVAGSYTPRVGGHNILEPCHYGKPVIFGPYMHSQPELERLVLDAHAGMKVGPEKLGEVLMNLLMTPSLCDALGQSGARLIEANRGSVARTLQALSKN